MPHMNTNAMLEKPEVKCTQKPSWVAGCMETPLMRRGISRIGSTTTAGACPGGASRTQASTSTAAKTLNATVMSRPVCQPRSLISGRTAPTAAI